MHKLMVPMHIYHFNFNYTQFGNNHRPEHHQLYIFV